MSGMTSATTVVLAVARHHLRVAELGLQLWTLMFPEAAVVEEEADVVDHRRTAAHARHLRAVTGWTRTVQVVTATVRENGRGTDMMAGTDTTNETDTTTGIDMIHVKESGFLQLSRGERRGSRGTREMRGRRRRGWPGKDDRPADGSETGRRVTRPPRTTADENATGIGRGHVLLLAGARTVGALHPLFLHKRSGPHDRRGLRHVRRRLRKELLRLSIASAEDRLLPVVLTLIREVRLDLGRQYRRQAGLARHP